MRPSKGEGQSVFTAANGDEPLRPGMILSNEPGYYKAGEYGIRIENLVLVVALESGEDERPFYGFETLSHTPIDRALIDTTLLTADERAWLNAYHARTLEIVAPQLEGAAQAWLQEACAPI